MECYVPPGFRFHPTEEELVGYYLNKKINSLKIDLDIITDIDLYRMEPWDIEGRCKLGYEEQNEWYFFSHKDRKYPTGNRTNRATSAGFWKATGRDKAVISKDQMIGMRKTLVFYKGRAPNGRKTDWIMHEYRIQTSENAPTQEEGWVVCRAFKKPNPSHKQGFEAWNHAYNLITQNRNIHPHAYHHNQPNPIFPSTSMIESTNNHQNPFPQDQQLIMSNQTPYENQLIHEIPNLDSPSISTSFLSTEKGDYQNSGAVDQLDYEEDKSSHSYLQNDWKCYDKLMTPQVFDPSSYACHSDQMIIPDDEEILMGCFNDL